MGHTYQHHLEHLIFEVLSIYRVHLYQNNLDLDMRIDHLDMASKLYPTFLNQKIYNLLVEDLLTYNIHNLLYQHIVGLAV